jgi:hypothetical protein
VLVERPGCGSLWSWLDGLGRRDVMRLTEWLDEVAKGEALQPRLDAGVDENISEPQVSFEHPELTSIRLRLRGDASPAKLLDQYEDADPLPELILDFVGIHTEDIREAAGFLGRSLS